MLDFWATWCPSCREAISHLNNLAKEFKNDDVVFISISDEKMEKITQFLKDTQINTWIGVDTDKSCFNDYTVKFIPQMFIIDKTGKVVKRLSSNELTKNIIKDYLKK